MTITRSFCPLDCGWHHDVDNTQLPAGVHVDITPEMSVDDIRDATTMAMALRQVQDAEGVIREHLESHELIEWVKALTMAQRQAERAGETVAGLRATLQRWAQAARDDQQDQTGGAPIYADAYESVLQRLDSEPASPEDLPELTVEDAVEAMQDMGAELYRAEDRLAFVREMCDLADREQRQVTTGQVRAWTEYVGCANATPDGAELAAGLARSLSVAIADLQPGADPVVCLHENARRTIKTTATAYEQIQVITTIYCPVCKNYAEQVEGQPFLGPVVLNATRCTQACAEQHTYRTGCLLALPVVPREQP